MRLGWHVNGPGPRDALAQGRPDLFQEYVAAVRPPIVKALAEGYSPGLADFCHRHGTKVVARKVVGELDRIGFRAAAEETIRWGEDSPGFDYLQFANEEMQGKDHPEDFDRLCGYALKFMDECDRRGWKAALLGTSVGQPEIVNWGLPNSRAMLRECEARGHIIASNEYYPRLPQDAAEQWENPRQSRGYYLLRCRRHVEAWQAHGFHGVKFFISESGQDSVPGTLGIGGWRRDDRMVYVPRMAAYGLRLGFVPGCVGWVGFGDFAPDRDYREDEKDWRMYALDYDIPVTRQMIGAMQALPTGGAMADTRAIFDEAERLHRRKDVHDEQGTGLRVNVTSGFNKWNHEHGYWPTINEAPFQSLGGRMGQRVQHPGTGAVRVLEWNGAVVVHAPPP